MPDVAVFASGHGSNLQALIDAADGYRVACVVSDRADAYALDRARAAGIRAEFVDPGAYAGRAAYDAALGEVLDRQGIRFVALAGFMRVLGSALVQRWRGRMLNVHPSLLPKYRGLDTHRRALAAGDHEHGASVHFVTEELDGGPVILQARIPLAHGDDPARVAARVQAQEHRVYPFVVGLAARGRIKLAGDRVLLDDRMLAAPLQVRADTDLSCVAA